VRILLADDDPVTRLVFESLVTTFGHDCVVAEDGTRAAQLVSSTPFDALFIDCMTAGVDASQLCRRAREEPAGTSVYVVLITGPDHPEHVLEGMSAGADDFLMKPVDTFAVQTRLVAAERIIGLRGVPVKAHAELDSATSSCSIGS
jgi:DNA-binding response OmpR family regulator